MTPMPTVAPNPCQLHLIHRPKALTSEAHHVVPVAWQLNLEKLDPTILNRAPYPGKDPDGRGDLWDARVEWCCPTGHRNVHWWIVQMMKRLLVDASDDPLHAYTALKPRRLGTEFEVAYDALIRYHAYGSLLALAQAGELGES